LRHGGRTPQRLATGWRSIEHLGLSLFFHLNALCGLETGPLHRSLASSCAVLICAVVQTGLYRKPEFKQQRLALEKALLMMLLSPLGDSAKEQLLDVLWGVGSTDWDEFVSTFLPQFCSICSELVQQRMHALTAPFADQSGSLNDSSHFSVCMDDFVNDVRFFQKLAAGPPASEE
jgi:hypothetical protein